MSQVAKVKFADYKSSIAAALDLIAAGARLPQQGLIIIKPNLTNSSPLPVPTSVTAAADVSPKDCRAYSADRGFPTNIVRSLAGKTRRQQ